MSEEAVTSLKFYSMGVTPTQPPPPSSSSSLPTPPGSGTEGLLFTSGGGVEGRVGGKEADGRGGERCGRLLPWPRRQGEGQSVQVHASVEFGKGVVRWESRGGREGGGGHLRIITDWEKQGRILLLPSLA
jgi:hypothetical protein